MKFKIAMLVVLASISTFLLVGCGDVNGGSRGNSSGGATIPRPANGVYRSIFNAPELGFENVSSGFLEITGNTMRIVAYHLFSPQTIEMVGNFTVNNTAGFVTGLNHDALTDFMFYASIFMVTGDRFSPDIDLFSGRVLTIQYVRGAFQFTASAFFMGERIIDTTNFQLLVG